MLIYHRGYLIHGNRQPFGCLPPQCVISDQRNNIFIVIGNTTSDSVHRIAQTVVVGHGLNCSRRVGCSMNFPAGHIVTAILCFKAIHVRFHGMSTIVFHGSKSVAHIFIASLPIVWSCD